MPYLAGGKRERPSQRVFFILPWRHACGLAPPGQPRRPDCGPQRDSECIRKDQPLMRWPVLGMPPNPRPALAPLWVGSFRYQCGAFPHPAHLMEPASDGPRGHLQALFCLKLRRQRGPTPPRPAPAIGPWWRLEESPPRALQPRPQEGGPDGGPAWAHRVDGAAQRLRALAAYNTVETRARAAQAGRHLGRLPASSPEAYHRQRAAIAIAGSAERSKHLGLLCCWDIQ